MELPVDSMEQQMALQQELMAAISHEIRTPVSRLSFALQLLKDGLEQEPKLVRQQQLLASCDDMVDDIDEINDLVAEVMTYIHLEDGGPRIIFQQVNVKEVLENLRSQYADLHPHLQISLAPDLPAKIIDVEPVQIRRACQNLVGNAVKYARTKIHLGYRLDGGFCVLLVEDDGEGIPETEYGRVFSPFTRLDESRNRSTGGFGLGLSIVRRIAYWHGGRAVAGRSEALGGANMMIRLPIHQPTDSLPVPSMAHLADRPA
ncbi:MAG: hypothetical protein HOD01_06940 [Oceanospirillaceae bacterium]|mgnify:FL=1|nr:hypothetical protein [Oceanospirillaceae bacterium]MBT4443032.1 hypothetical protein [Oceanospirillaceae bacterium]